MTQNTFTVNGSGNFATPGNWTLGHVPNSGEDAEIDPSGSGFAVESNTETVASIGTATNDGLVIDNGASLFAFNGTGPNANDGTISVVNADLFLNDGTFDNPGLLDLEGVTSSIPATLAITGSMTLDGGGGLSMVIGAGPADNFIVGDNANTTPTLVNVDNTISAVACRTRSPVFKRVTRLISHRLRSRPEAARSGNRTVTAERCRLLTAVATCSRR
jgi:hypothetical protein